MAVILVRKTVVDGQVYVEDLHPRSVDLAFSYTCLDLESNKVSFRSVIVQLIKFRIHIIMHLLNVDTLELETFHDVEAPIYTILSHTWGEEEVSYTDIQNPRSNRTTSLTGFDKVRKTCDRARIDGYRYVWIDTCCIDKSSSAELSEAINSMYQWYREASICYVYLSDVVEAEFEANFPLSRWFKRGWTLQELLAPEDVVFYDRNWVSLGTKDDHADWISIITGIDSEALLPGGQHEDFTEATLGRFCIAKRMSWASNRETTRIEDMAYCLLGIFKINMPLLYGERERAFIRLQEELIKNYDDDSILAWDLDTTTWDTLGLVPSEVEYSICATANLSSILAGSPRDFNRCHDLEFATTSSTKPFMINNAGLQIELPLIPVYPPEPYYNNQAPDEVQGWIGLLSCSTGVEFEFLGIVLWPAGLPRDSPDEVIRVSYRSSDQWQPQRHTVLVGARAAMQAQRRTVTVTQQSECRTIRDYFFGYRHFIVNESQALLDAGYVVSNATAKNLSNVGWAFGYHPRWDAMTKTLTIGGSFVDSDLLRFEFENSRSSSGFIVLVRGDKVVVHEGVSITDTEERSSYQYLGQASDIARGIILQNYNGTNRFVTISLRENIVAHSRIVEVNVDLQSHDSECV